MAQIIKKVQKFQNGQPILNTSNPTIFKNRIAKEGDEYKYYNPVAEGYINDPEKDEVYTPKKAEIPVNFIKASDSSGYKLEDLNRAFNDSYDYAFTDISSKYKKLDEQRVKDRVRELIDQTGKGIDRVDKGRYYGSGQMTGLNTDDKNDKAA